MNASGSAAIGNQKSGIALYNGPQKNVIGGNRTGTACSGPCNLISGNYMGVKGPVGTGTMSNPVTGNYIGVNAAGTISVPNATSGIVLLNGPMSNTIGGIRSGIACDGPCNLISGNKEAGVRLSGSGTITNPVTGNYIGVNAAGTISVPNTLMGVAVENGATYITIGGIRPVGPCSGTCNLIRGNGGAGVAVISDTTRYITIRGIRFSQNGRPLTSVTTAPQRTAVIRAPGRTAG